MSYIAKAFIKCSDELSKDKLGRAIDNLNYKYNFVDILNSEIDVNTYSFDGEYMNFHCEMLSCEYPDFINCNYYANGDEEKAIELFLELIKMDINKPETLYYSVINNLYGIQGQQIRGFLVKYNDINKLHPMEQNYIRKNNPICGPFEFAEYYKDGIIDIK